MVQRDTLASVLTEFARTLTTDFPIQAILDHLVVRIVGVLPVTAAGVTLISDDTAPLYVAASDASALRYEKLQSEVGEGPCLSAYRGGESVSVPDLAADGRFPLFGPAAVAAGLAAVWTFPLRHGDGCLGALDLYRDRTGDLAPDDMDAAQTLADVAAAYLLNARAREDARTVSEGFRRQAFHDALTGLPNRSLLEERIAHAARRAQRSRTLAAVLFADLDRFKLVNDTYGHDVGDQLLLAVAQRLTHLVRPGDTLARVSGDEFVFLCEDLDDAADAETLARRIDDAFVAPFTVGSLAIDMSASVGMALAGRGEPITSQLLVEADAAMYQKKRAGGRGHRVVDLTRPRTTSDGSRLAADLRSALEAEELSVHYQPVVDLADGRVSGVEALLRWDDRTRGRVGPAQLVEVAEQSGLVHELGAWVLERACRDRARWGQVHPSVPIDLAVNVSGSQLRRPEFGSTVTSVLRRTGVDPARLVLEITEGVLIEDYDRVVEALGTLRTAGVRTALDDFGTGYSSLSYLRRLPVDIVKIDRSFVQDIGHDRSALAMITAIVQLADACGLTVTAEGVETSGQRRGLLSAGCRTAQGFLFSVPLTADGVLMLLTRAAGAAGAPSGTA